MLQLFISLLFSVFVGATEVSPAEAVITARAVLPRADPTIYGWRSVTVSDGTTICKVDLVPLSDFNSSLLSFQ